MFNNKVRMTQSTIMILGFFLERLTNETAGSDVFKATGIASGTLYPILHRLEKQGWLRSRLEEIDPNIEGRPRKRLYRLTGAGEQAANERLKGKRTASPELGYVTNTGVGQWVY